MLDMNKVIKTQVLDNETPQKKPKKVQKLTEKEKPESSIESDVKLDVDLLLYSENKTVMKKKKKEVNKSVVELKPEYNL